MPDTASPHPSDVVPKPTLPVPSDDDKTSAMLAHLLSIVLLGASMGWLAPLIFYLTKKDTSPFVKFHALQGLYFQLVTIPLALATCGVWLIAAIVVEVMWCIKAKDGEWKLIPVVGKWAWPPELGTPPTS
jgi:uncharacterized membrane protein